MGKVLSQYGVDLTDELIQHLAEYFMKMNVSDDPESKAFQMAYIAANCLGELQDELER